MVDDYLRALATTLATYLPTLPGYSLDLGHTYEMADSDPTPETISLPGGKPVIGFIDPYQGVYDTPDGEQGPGPTMGWGGQTTDRCTVLVLVFIAPYQVQRLGYLQRAARPWARYAIKDCIRQHNTLKCPPTYPQPVIWRARATGFETGPFPWGSADGSPNWFVVRVAVELTDDRSVTPGS